MLPAWTEANAHFSTLQHQVWLRRRLSIFGAPIAFVLHNPSYAGHEVNDPTARHGIAFATALDGSDLIFVNAATGIATDADALAGMADPIGPMADEALRFAAEACLSRNGLLIAAWSAPKGKAATRQLMDARFRAILALRLPLHVLRLTSSGCPEHPLYPPGNLRPMLWADAEAA